MNFRRRLIACVAAAAIVAGAGASSRTWEEIDRYPNQTTVTMMNGTDQEDVRVTTRDGYVYISVHQPSNVKVFTILGQLIVQQQLRPGNYRFRLGARGIYLLKAGSMTRRVTI